MSTIVRVPVLIEEAVVDVLLDRSGEEVGVLDGGAVGAVLDPDGLARRYELGRFGDQISFQGVVFGRVGVSIVSGGMNSTGT